MSETSRPPVEIRLDRISKRFSKGHLALDRIDLTISPGERLVVLGRSGSGKSTLLRVIAGLEPATEGRVIIAGRDQAEIPTYRRDTAMIFQNPSLFPHLSVFENLAFGLRAREKAEIVAPRVVETAALMGLSDLLERRPAALSGGERQRVAIGRAVAWRPRILLLDEPFSSLDAPLRASLRDEILSLHRCIGMTLIHVTHDQGEALAMGDRVAVLDRGRIVQCDTPRRLYERPAHRNIGEFVGSPPMNILPCEIVREANQVRIYRFGDESTLIGIDRNAEAGPFSTLRVGERRRLDLGIRPEDVRVIPDNFYSAEDLDGTSVCARVERVEYQGHECWVQLLLGRDVVKSRSSGESQRRVADAVRVILRFENASWFDPKTGLAAIFDDDPFAERK